ncbi:sialate O-acetylesterase [Prevotella sp. P6B1]|uniref:sialate O-acetylesterase n=1 Tax=Prevotella sp. P6B1 TaxID=1410613 RepID=UPI0009DEAD98|nr:sialate O-acetylesterase [Prevotella sp. P6B1]
MRKTIITLCMMLAGMGVQAEVDPHFYIYLCFGQSNMEGNAQWESPADDVVDPRFQMLATTNFTNLQRTMGNWYTASCPIVSPTGKLGMSDYFGRTMVAALPQDTKVGVVAVAMGGSPIEMFDKDEYQQTLTENPDAWWATLSNMHYGGNPYGRLIEMAKKAQQVGVIKGILLHQGCSNCGDPNWPNKVKKIYQDMLTDLGLQAADVPLFVGETEQADMGGGCAGHNAVVAQIPTVIPTGHVVSSVGIPGNGDDAWHFSAAGYRTFGKRYAYEALKVLGLQAQKATDYTMPDNMKNLTTLKTLENPGDLQIRIGGSKALTIWGEFADGHRENLTNEVTFSSTDFTITNGVVSGTVAKKGVITVSYTDFMGTLQQMAVNVEVSDKGPNHVLVVDNGTAGSNPWDKQLHCTLTTPMTTGKTYVVKARIKADNPGDCALWPLWTASPERDDWNNSKAVQYEASYQLTSEFKEFTWEFNANYTIDRLQFAFGKIGGQVYFDDVTCEEKGGSTELVPNGGFESDNIADWAVIGYMGQTMTIGEFELTSEISRPRIRKAEATCYDLNGCAVKNPRKGLYIKDGKKVFIKN